MKREYTISLYFQGKGINWRLDEVGKEFTDDLFFWRQWKQHEMVQERRHHHWRQKQIRFLVDRKVKVHG